MRKNNPGVTIDELCKGKLPKHLIRSIGNLRITTRELEDWAQSRQPFYLGIKDGCLIFEIRIRVKLKKAIALTGGFIGGVGALVKLVIVVLPMLKKSL